LITGDTIFTYRFKSCPDYKKNKIMKKFELTEEQLKRLIEVGMEIITDFKVTEKQKKMVVGSIVEKLIKDIDNGKIDISRDSK
jgi:hypothetical protein